MNKQVKMTKETKKIWNFYSVDNVENTKQVDFSGAIMAKASYGDINSEFGWNEDHICPRNIPGFGTGSNTYENIQPVSIRTNIQKSNNTNGLIKHDYFCNNEYVFTVYTNFTIKYNPFFETKSNSGINGIIYINSQWKIYKNGEREQGIENIYFYDSVGYVRRNDKKYFYQCPIDINKSIEKKYLFFQQGNDTNKWNSYVKQNIKGDLIPR